MKQSNVAIKIDLIISMKNTIVDYLYKSYSDRNIITICQSISPLKNKTKVLNKPCNSKSSYFLIDDSVITPVDSA